MNLEFLVDLEFDAQEAAWRNYERTMQESPELAHLIAKPDTRLTKDQIRARISGNALAAQNFSMRTVVTGARRKWKRNA